MNASFTLMLMVFLHIVDDYYLQGWLASAKQKRYWEENAPDKLYKNDYKCALWMHSLSWSFMVMLPIALSMRFNVSLLFVIVYFINVEIHSTVDNLKANERKINLWQDQIIHLCQIFITAYIFLH